MAPGALAATTETYLLVYKSLAVPSDAAARVEQAGGELIAGYNAIGVAVARSSSPTFKSAILSDKRLAASAATSKTGVRLNDALDDGAVETVNIPASDTDSLSGLQWDMVQIHTPEAHAITGGSPTVVVGDIDTGLDFTHPDLAPNVDFATAPLLERRADPAPAAWNDDNGHGTHTAGTIAAASNGIGIVGVAPNVKIAGIKAGNADGLLLPGGGGLLVHVGRQPRHRRHQQQLLR